MNFSERGYLQALFVLESGLLRMAEPIALRTFGPRLGHETSSILTTYRAGSWIFETLDAGRQSPRHIESHSM
jgi:hypothetical protein